MEFSAWLKQYAINKVTELPLEDKLNKEDCCKDHVKEVALANPTQTYSLEIGLSEEVTN